jgi:hypothetical protein
VFILLALTLIGVTIVIVLLLALKSNLKDYCVKVKIKYIK